MLTKDVRFEGFTTEDWSRLLSLWKSTREPAERPDEPRGGLIALHARGRLRKLLHTGVGRVDPGAGPWPVPLSELASRHGAKWVLAAEAGGLAKLSERFGARTRLNDDISAHLKLLLEIARELSREGTIEIWPNHIERLAFPTQPFFGNTLGTLYPNGHLAMIVLFHEGELWTSVALERSGLGVSRIVGPDELRHHVGFLSGDFRRDYRYVLAAAEEALGPVAVACFSELSIFRALQAERSWSAWVRAVALRDVILSPLKSSLAAPLAADAAVIASAAANSMGKRWESLGLVLSLWRKWR
jgi:hypothetical protein